MSIKESWKKLSLTEKLLLGTAVILTILIIIRWDTISDEVVGGFKKLFEKPRVN